MSDFEALKNTSIFTGEIDSTYLKLDGPIDFGNAALVNFPVDNNTIVINNSGLLGVNLISDSNINGMSSSKLIGVVVNSQIDTLDASKITNVIVDSQIDTLDASKITNVIVDSQIDGMSSSKLIGQVTNSQISDMASNKLSGYVQAAQFSVNQDIDMKTYNISNVTNINGVNFNTISNPTSTFFAKGGNSFGTSAVLGTFDNNDMYIYVNNTPAVYIDKKTTDVTFNNNTTSSNTNTSSIYNSSGNQDFPIKVNSVKRVVSTNSRTFTGASSTFYPFNHPCANNSMLGGTIQICIQATNGTDYQSYSNRYDYVCVNKGGALSYQHVRDTYTSTTSSGTIAVVDADSPTGTTYRLGLTVTSSLTGTVTWTYYFTVINNSNQDITIN